MYKLGGSIAFAGLARAVWIVSKDRLDDKRRLFLQAKNNLGEDRAGLAYRIEPRQDGEISSAVVAWDPTPVAMHTDDAFISQDDADGGCLKEAQDYLKTFLEDGPVPSKTIIQAAEDAGISQRTLRRAKERLKVGAQKVGSAWRWQLPEEPPPSTQF